MNFRKAQEWSIGVDLGTGSVGWVAVDSSGKLFSFKGKPTWGVRLFPDANGAADRRAKRSQRRRYERRRQRIDCLQSLFLDEMEGVDSEFFVRLNQSRLHQEDRDDAYETDYIHPFFNGADFTESEYYDRFPTIWHLRKWLMETEEKADLRLVYLALHNLVKHRGNFLQESNKSLSAANANASGAASALVDALCRYCEEVGDDELSCMPDVDSLQHALDAIGGSREQRVLDIAKALGLSDGKRAKQIARACIGFKVDYANVFVGLEKGDATSLYIFEDDKVEEFLAVCPDEAAAVFEAIRGAYSSYVLVGLLNGKSSLSDAMVESYERHAQELRAVKGLVRDYLGLDEYRRLFRGPKFADGDYDFNRVEKGSYTSYILGDKLCNKAGTTQDEMTKEFRRLFDANPCVKKDPRYLQIRESLESDDGRFLAKQRTRTNGAIPMQLQKEEMDRIIESQGKHYPFLREHKDLLDKVISSRIPYYVGPLNAGPDPDGPFPANSVDPTRKFAWSVRKSGMEHVKAYPWNVDEVIDKDTTAELFIQRMTGSCTYLFGEPVLPRCSLLYEEFCVLNELNSVKWSFGGGRFHRLDFNDREDLVEDVFKSRKSVSHRAVCEWLERRSGSNGVQIVGTQGEKGFESKLSSYNDFCRILGVKRLEDEDCLLQMADIEQIILWSTVFEDRDILKRKLIASYGEVLTSQQVKSIVNRRYSGWGRLSRRLLSGLTRDTPLGRWGIIDVLRYGNPFAGQHRKAMNLMEILGDDDLGFKELIDQDNRSRFDDDARKLTIQDLPGSPALRRSVNQAMRIIDELTSVAGFPPSRICIEVTRDDDLGKKGSRTKTRYKRLLEAVSAYKKDMHEYDPEVERELRDRQANLDDDRLLLYFAQCGKSLYSGKRLSLDCLSEYQIDHILPQSYIKDDSIDNKALVLASENQRKLDSLLLDRSIIDRQKRWWDALRRAGLISEKKYRNLTCTELSDRMLQGFINRQLVETSQVVKFVRQMCEQRYPNSEVVSLRASLSHGLRDRCDLAKCREMNDYHHAHDAYLACQMARFIGYRYPRWQDGFDLSIIRRYAKQVSSNWVPGKSLPGRSGFIVESFLRSGFDKSTGEIFRDAWDAEGEIASIRKALNIKQCFISRMPVEQSGAFWEETIYSPRDTKNGKNLSIPLKVTGKEGYLDPKKYGGSNTPLRAYFFIYTAKDSKEKVKYFFEGVPCNVAVSLGKSPEGLAAYAEELAAMSGCHDARVLRSKIPLRQKFELDGTEYYLFGRSGSSNEIRPGTEFAGSLELAKVLNRIKNDRAEDGEYEHAYDAFAEGVSRTCPKLSSALDLHGRRDSFIALPSKDKAKVLFAIAGCLKGSSQGCDLKAIGGKAKSGFLLQSLASALQRITWIDQSVSGIFEKRTTFEELVNGL